MISVDTAVTGGTLVTASGTLSATIGIRAGSVAVVADPSCVLDAREVIDARGKVVVPGIIDAHVHMREPGYVHKEGFESGTMAAAAGGVTTVMVMPTTNPPTLTPSDFEEKARLAEGKAYVDFAIQAGVGEDLAQIDALARLGAVSFELFMADLPAPLRVRDAAHLLEIFERVEAAGAVAGVTPGNDAIVQARRSQLERAGSESWLAFGRSRPPIAEAIGTAEACLLAEEVGVRLHLRQISSRFSAEVVRAARCRSPRVTAEVHPHHLLLTEAELERQGAFAKMAPPLRAPEDIESLWKALMDGVIDIVDTDHAPHLPEEKAKGGADVWGAPGGIPGVQTLLPLMLEQVAAGRLSLCHLVRVCTEGPARIFDLYPRKGTLQVGSDADLVIIDLHREMTIENSAQLSRARITPFAGWRVRGYPCLTMVRGEVVMRDGKIEGRPRGSLVTPRRNGA